LPLTRNFAWTLVGNLVYAAAQWTILVIVAKRGTLEMVGQLALGLAVATPVILFSSLQLRAVAATDAATEFLFGEYLVLRVKTTAAALFVILGIVLSAGYNPTTAAVVLGTALGKSIDSISDIYYGLLQRVERMDRIAMSMLAKGVLSVVGAAAGLALSHGVLGAVLGSALASLVVLICYDAPCGKKALVWQPPLHGAWHRSSGAGRSRFWDRNSIRLIRLTLPLGFVALVLSLSANVPRYFIEHYQGPRALGIFAALSYVTAAGSTVINALGQAAAPRFARHHANGERLAFRALLLQLLGLGFSIGLGGVIAALVGGGRILAFAYRQEYAAHVRLFVWLMIAGGVSYIASFLGYAITAARCYNVQALIALSMAAATAAGCYWLVPRYGMEGAAGATLLSGLVQILGCVWAFLSHPKIMPLTTSEPAHCAI